MSTESFQMSLKNDMLFLSVSSQTRQRNKNEASVALLSSSVQKQQQKLVFKYAQQIITFRAKYMAALSASRMISG